jgi:histidinol-phosphate phosphatase family protein
VFDARFTSLSRGNNVRVRPPDSRPTVRALLFDRDGTLVEDVPYNGDPALVRPMPGALEAVATARATGMLTGVVTNQSGVGRGLLAMDEVAAVNARVDELFGTFPVWQLCPHRPDEGCTCRKPKPGMVFAACAALRVDPASAVMIGDTGADVAAALAAGARAVLVPNPVTRREEIAEAPAVARSLPAAVELAMTMGQVVRA